KRKGTCTEPSILEEYRNSSQVKKFLFDTKEEILMHLWRYASLSIHGIESASDQPGAKTAISGRVVGKFSIRLVPPMDTSVVAKQAASASARPARSA
ncbi:hypothetical protein MC885_004967, partial [Smutsia gigantea]